MQYHIQPENWKTEPLENTLPDDDSGYREVKTLPDNTQTKLVTPTQGIIRQPYAGQNIYNGASDDPLRLRGGTDKNEFLVREQVARGIDYISQEILRKLFGGEYQLILLDGLRTAARQADGHAGVLKQNLERAGITNPEPADILKHGRDADRLFSFVNIAKTDAYTALLERLMKNERFVASIENAMEMSKSDLNFQQALKVAIEEYIAISANSGIGLAADEGLVLDAEKNVHAGGGTFDTFIADAKGMPLTIVPFDYMSRPELISLRFMEDDRNYDVFMKAVSEDPVLQEHLKRLGYANPEVDFKRADWNIMREARRVHIRSIIALGGTSYMDEPWHFTLGRKIDGLDGKPIAEEGHTKEFGDSGATGHTVIKEGRSGTAVWGGASALKLVEEEHGGVAL